MRNEQLLNIRPHLSIEEKDLMSEIEQFQNTTLRPILKLQSYLLVILFMDSRGLQKINIQNKNDVDKRRIVTEIMKSDQKLKNTLVSIVIAMMTDAEIEFYMDNKSEINRRILTMANERLVDQI